jgi:hypothetical protein
MAVSMTNELLRAPTATQLADRDRHVQQNTCTNDVEHAFRALEVSSFVLWMRLWLGECRGWADLENP